MSISPAPEPPATVNVSIVGAGLVVAFANAVVVPLSFTACK